MIRHALTVLLLTVAALVELALVLAVWHLKRRFPAVVAYLRSAFDEPSVANHASMARICAYLAMLAALVVVAAFIVFVFVFHDAVGMAGIIAGVLTTLLGTGVLGLLLRKRADGSTEPDDDRPAAAPVIAPVVVQPTTVVAPAAPAVVP
jgi:hypothetical protein